VSARLTQGPVPRRVLGLAWPTAVAMGLQTLYALVDLAFVGALGPAALAGLGIGLQLSYAIFAFAQVFGTPALADVSRGLGAERAVRRTVGTYLAVSLGTSVLAAAGLFLGRHALAAALAPDAASLAAATAYLTPLVWTLVSQTLLMVLASTLRAGGDAQTPLLALIVSVGLNIGLDAVLIFGLGPLPALGLAGAGWATLIATTAAVVLLLVGVLRRPDLRPGWPLLDRAFARSVLGTGVPATTQLGLFALTLLLILVALRDAGAVWAGGAAAGFRLMQQGLVPFMALGTAGAAVAGQAAGSGAEARVRRTIRFTYGLSAGLGLVVAAGLWLGADTLAWALLGDAPTARTTVSSLRWLALGVPATGAALALTLMFQGLHRPMVPLGMATARVLVLGLLILTVLDGPSAVLLGVSSTFTLEALLQLGWLIRRLPRPILAPGASA
jgi:putative MATE family efflux protein